MTSRCAQNLVVCRFAVDDSVEKIVFLRRQVTFVRSMIVLDGLVKSSPKHTAYMIGARMSKVAATPIKIAFGDLKRLCLAKRMPRCFEVRMVSLQKKPKEAACPTQRVLEDDSLCTSGSNELGTLMPPLLGFKSRDDPLIPFILELKHLPKHQHAGYYSVRTIIAKA